MQRATIRRLPLQPFIEVRKFWFGLVCQLQIINLRQSQLWEDVQIIVKDSSTK